MMESSQSRILWMYKFPNNLQVYLQADEVLREK